MTKIRISPYWTKGKKAETLISWKRSSSIIKNRKGEIIFELKDVESPEGWSVLAVDIAASKYFIKDLGQGRKNKSNKETSVRQMVQRVVAAICKSAQKQKYFTNKKEIQNFEQELKYILLTQKAAFNSPVWFNVGVYEKPQCSACFIQSIEDSLEGIFELAKVEARLFKYGSGTGTNFSTLRSKYENLNKGGTSSGLISFLEVLDKGAGAIKSGGTTRRAAKMNVVDADHPEILDFIDWKMLEEQKAAMLINSGLSSDFEGPAYRTVSGQNANNSVRVTDAFLKAVQEKKDWNLIARTTGKTTRTLPAHEVWQRLTKAAWTCADPGLQFHDTINAWHTCPAGGPIRASNPCSEYMFLDNSACNLASLNLGAFLNEQDQFDLIGYLHTIRMMFIAQEVLVDFASYPTEQIAENSHKYRPLGLGFANLGSFLMRKMLSYKDPESQVWASVLSALLTGQAYSTSVELAQTKKSFKGYAKNKKQMQKVMAKHFQAVKKITSSNSELKELIEVNLGLWENLIDRGKKTGFRNAQATAIAPTGTIGLLMDCDTTGIEPEFSLVKIKKMAGGGEVEIVNKTVSLVLKKLGYSEAEREVIAAYLKENHSLKGCSLIKKEHLDIFSCAADIPTENHLLMMSAVQPFVSGAISKTVNLPRSAGIEDISKVFFHAWELGLKSIAIYRDGSKLSQPLSQKAFVMKCPICAVDTELHSGCYRCPNCGHTVGCA